MIVLLGFRYYVMSEATKIKRKIDFLLDRWNNVPESERAKIEMQLRVQRDKLKAVNGES